VPHLRQRALAQRRRSADLGLGILEGCGSAGGAGACRLKGGELEACLLRGGLAQLHGEPAADGDRHERRRVGGRAKVLSEVRVDPVAGALQGGGDAGKPLFGASDLADDGSDRDPEF
jgi:hypothetical protein